MIWVCAGILLFIAILIALGGAPSKGSTWVVSLVTIAVYTVFGTLIAFLAMTTITIATLPIWQGSVSSFLSGLSQPDRDNPTNEEDVT